ncbi:MAG: histidine kinase [Bacteroidetes bacterium]|nr:histidine kinase [Bacteroidota bacterium]
MSYLSKGKMTLTQLQYLVWLAILLISFISMLSSDGVAGSALFSLNGVCFYALIIYGNIHFLYPRFFQKKRYILYTAGAILLVAIAGFVKGYISLYISSQYFHKTFRIQDTATHLSFFLSGVTIFVLSLVIRLAIAYFAVKQQSEEALLQRSQFELKLLKAQVQPHFLFNTLNNMYYEAYMEAPRTALLIERLSEIMRYFIDQNIEDLVPIETEVQFLENYIALEKIRILPEPQIEFLKSFKPGIQLPPMLLMTFVENIFKHGIDKISGDNQIRIRIVEKDGYIIFETSNTINQHPGKTQPNGLGLKNLKQRLSLLYGTNFELNTRSDIKYFTAFLKIPLS